METINTPYIDVLKNTLKTNKRMLECLEKRLILIHENYTSKSEYEKNEIEIAKIKTYAEIDALTKIISEKEKYFVSFVEMFTKELEECEKNYESVIEKAKKSTLKGVAELLSKTNEDEIKTNAETKVRFYKHLKDLLK